MPLLGTHQGDVTAFFGGALGLKYPPGLVSTAD